MDTEPTDPPGPVPTEPRPTRTQLYAAIAERHEREHAEDTRVRRRFWVRIACYCWLWALAGLVLGAFAFRVNDVEIGKALLLSGQAVTIGGVLGTLAYALVQAEKRGWR